MHCSHVMRALFFLLLLLVHSAGNYHIIVFCTRKVVNALARRAAKNGAILWLIDTRSALHDVCKTFEPASNFQCRIFQTSRPITFNREIEIEGRAAGRKKICGFIFRRVCLQTCAAVENYFYKIGNTWVFSLFCSLHRFLHKYAPEGRVIFDLRWIELASVKFTVGLKLLYIS